MSAVAVQVIAGILMMVSLVAAGYIIGVYSERLKWNKLIDKGIIPAPKKR